MYIIQMAELNTNINTTCLFYQGQFDKALKGDDRDALEQVLKDIFRLPIEDNPKWALFPLYVIYELLYRFARFARLNEEKLEAYTILVKLVSEIIQDPAQRIQADMIHSFFKNVLRSGRNPEDNDELTDLIKNRRLLSITLGPNHTVTFETFLKNVVGIYSGGKSRRRRQHRSFRSKKRGRKTLRKHRN